jgi:hypothetical protein
MQPISGDSVAGRLSAGVIALVAALIVLPPVLLVIVPAIG